MISVGWREGRNVKKIVMTDTTVGPAWSAETQLTSGSHRVKTET